jgi:hypothetical protein
VTLSRFHRNLASIFLGKSKTFTLFEFYHYTKWFPFFFQHPLFLTYVLLFNLNQRNAVFIKFSKKLFLTGIDYMFWGDHVCQHNCRQKFPLETKTIVKVSFNWQNFCVHFKQKFFNEIIFSELLPMWITNRKEGSPLEIV